MSELQMGIAQQAAERETWTLSFVETMVAHSLCKEIELLHIEGRK